MNQKPFVGAYCLFQTAIWEWVNGPITQTEIDDPEMIMGRCCMLGFLTPDEAIEWIKGRSAEPSHATLPPPQGEKP